MSDLSALRNALLKLDDAEEAVFELCKVYHPSSDMRAVVNAQYEVVGDAASVVRNILREAEEEFVERNR